MFNLDDSDFEPLFAEVETLLQEAEQFLVAAAANKRAMLVSPDNSAIAADEVKFLRSEALTRSEQASLILARPELMIEPQHIAKRAQLLLRAAEIASGNIESNQILTELRLHDVPSSAEISLSKPALEEQEAQNHLKEVRDSMLRLKANGFDRHSLFWGRINVTAELRTWGQKYYRANTSWWRRLFSDSLDAVECEVNLDSFPMNSILGWKRLVLLELRRLGFKLKAYVGKYGSLEICVYF